ncbi:hypothetical protein CYY_003614 [Polysphondylium violaceum]|uniref:Uncharacterized protein n=1 Tax=Polysphondylium violaceum TaxID=133409 RepID=A0A8J4PY66_9MYCE|nr:hypothetical protein CYY_003614 [Polysphondylium violaceum]
MNTLIKSTSTLLFVKNAGESMMVRGISNMKNNAPRSRKTTMILSNGATIDFHTSLPYAKVWRSEVDIFSDPPVYVMSSLKDLRKKRKKEWEEKIRAFYSGR